MPARCYTARIPRRARHRRECVRDCRAARSSSPISSSQLLDDDREFDAVVAHEIGHQQHRHALRQTLRGSAVAIVAAFFAGDVSSASTVVVAVPTFLLDEPLFARVSRTRPIDYAFDLLARHGESPHWFAEAMRKLEADASGRIGRWRRLSFEPSGHRGSHRRADAARGRSVRDRASGSLPERRLSRRSRPTTDDPDCDDCDDDDRRQRLRSRARLRKDGSAVHPNQTACSSSGTSLNRSPTRP